MVQLTKLLVAHQKHPFTFNPHCQEVMEVFKEVQDYSTVLECEDENINLFFNFLVRMIIPSMDNYEAQKKIMTTLAKKSNHIYNYSQSISRNLEEKFHLDLSETDIISYHYHEILLTIFNSEIGIPFDQNPFFSDFNMSFFENTNDFHIDILKTFHDIFDNAATQYQQVLINAPLLYVNAWFLLVEKQRKTSLKIGVFISETPLGDIIIKKRITQIFNNNLIEFIEDAKDADLIISDCTYFEESDQDFFFMNSILVPENWENLYKKISLLLGEMSFNLY